jgi:hypothetical protein
VQAALSDPNQHQDLKNLLYNTDGDIPQLNAAVNDEKMRAIGRSTITGIMKKKTGKSKHLHHRLMKISGGCSPFQAANDASTVHRSAKKMTGANSVVQQQRFDDNDQDEMMKKFVEDVFDKGVGKDIAASRKLLMTQYVKNSIRVFDVAFSKHNIQEGWRAIGAFYPHDPVRIMSKWPGWVKLQPAQGVDILQAIEEDFAPIIPRAGRLLDSIVSERLPFLPPPQIENVAELGVHRERAVVLGDLFDAARALAAPERVLREERKRDKDAQQAALPVANTVIRYDQRGFGRFNAADVKAQLKLRKVPFKNTDKLGVLEELWKAHDANHISLLNAVAAGSVAGGGNGGGGGGACAAAVALAPAAAEAVHLPAGGAAAPSFAFIMDASAPVAAHSAQALHVPGAHSAEILASAALPRTRQTKFKCSKCGSTEHRGDNVKCPANVANAARQ